MPVAGSLHCRPPSLSWNDKGAVDLKCVRLMTRWSDEDSWRGYSPWGNMHSMSFIGILSKWKTKTPLVGTRSLVDLQYHLKPLWGVERVVTWLILPVVICLSQRLSHACLSINKFVLWNCEWLIKSVIVYLMIPCYMDNCGNSRANTCIKQPRLLEGVYLLDKKPTRLAAPLVIHNNLSNRMALCWRCIIQISALSTFDGRIEAYHGFNG